MLYFGCWTGELGHYMFTPGGQRLTRKMEDLLPEVLRSGAIDCHFIGPPNQPGQPVNRAFLVHIRDYTVLAFWDRSVDRRHNSNSAFIMPGTHDFEFMIKQAEKDFPDVYSRIVKAGGALINVLDEVADVNSHEQSAG